MFQTKTSNAASRLLLTLGLCSFAMTPAWSGGLVQLDLAHESSTFVAALGDGEWDATFVASEWGDGNSLSFSLTNKVIHATEDQPLNLSLGIAYRDHTADIDDDSFSEFGVKAVLDAYLIRDWGNSYWRAEVSSIESGYLLMTQIFPKSTSFGLELLAAGDTTHDGQSIGLLYRINESPLTLRAGYRVDGEEAFIGFSYNTF